MQVGRWGAGRAATHVESFKDYIAQHTGEDAQLLVQRFPIMADFRIESAERFAEHFLEQASAAERHTYRSKSVFRDSSGRHF